MQCFQAMSVVYRDNKGSFPTRQAGVYTPSIVCLLLLWLLAQTQRSDHPGHTTVAEKYNLLRCTPIRWRIRCTFLSYAIAKFIFSGGTFLSYAGGFLSYAIQIFLLR